MSRRNEDVYPTRSHGWSRPWLLSAAYAGGVLLALTALAAVLNYVVDPGGRAIGKLDTFWWVWLIDFFLALPAFIGFRLGLAVVDWRADRPCRWRTLPIAATLGVVFVGTMLLVRPVFGYLGPGLLPALAYLIAGSVFVPFIAGWVDEKLARRTEAA